VSRGTREDEGPEAPVAFPAMSTTDRFGDVAVANAIHRDRSPFGHIDK
jgi:hypothetical protein